MCLPSACASPQIFLFKKIRITIRKILLLVATKRYVSVNKIYIVSLSIKGEVQTASKNNEIST